MIQRDTINENDDASDDSKEKSNAATTVVMMIHDVSLLSFLKSIYSTKTLVLARIRRQDRNIESSIRCMPHDVE